MKYIPVGRVLGTHGLKGEVKFRYYNEAKEDFLKYGFLYSREGDLWTEFELTERRLRKGLFTIRFKGLESLDEVFPLVNSEMFVREEDLPRLESDEYYDYQLVGLDVVVEGNGKVGKVMSVVHTKANDLLAVFAGKEEMFIPLVDEYIVRIDLENSSVVVGKNALSV